MSCDRCAISDECYKARQLGTGKKSAKIMFVADQPSEFENKKNKWMIGKGGKLLRNVLEQLDIDVDNDCYFTGIVKCPTPDDRPPTKEEIENCRDYLEAEIKVINPDIIVPMGNISLKEIYGKTGITKFRGKAVEKDDRIIFPILHPINLFRQPVHTKNFTRDVQNLKLLMLEGATFLEKSDVEYNYLETVEEIEEEINRMMESEWVVFDLETTGLNPFVKGSKIVCIALTDRDHYGVTIPLEHRDFKWDNPEDFTYVVNLLKKLLENPKVKKMAHNGKFDMKWLLARYGIDVANLAFDPMLAHYLAVSEERGGHGLKELAWEHTDMGGYDNALDEFKMSLPESIRYNYDNIPWEILREYASADVDCTFRLYKKFWKKVYNNPKWVRVYEDILLEGSYALRDMECNGILLEPDRLEEYEEAYPRRIQEIEDKLRQYPEVVQIEREKLRLYELRKIEMKKPKDERDQEILKYNKYKDFSFNFGSTAQLRELLFGKLGLTTPFITDTAEAKKRTAEKRKEKWAPTINDLSTGKETLAFLEDKHPIANLLSEWRKLEKVYGTYVAPARDWVGEDGLVHPTFNLTGTVTGRLSSEAPNAQNFPRKSNDPLAFQYKYGVKKMFGSRFGDMGVIVQFDYSQLELRVAGIFSNDPQLIKAYRDGKDLHIYVASKVYGVPEEEVTKDQRTAAKAVGFGLLYGKGARSLSVDMGVSLEEAEEFINKYFEEFSGVKAWLDNTKKAVMKNKYVETLTGRHRRLPGVDSNDKGVQSDCFRQAINSPIQSSGSDMTMTSIILINKEFKRRNLKSCLAITVHDSIVADVYVPELEEVYYIMKGTMENLPFDWITVPIVADAEVGREYGTLVGLDLEELKNYKDVFEYIDTKVEAEHNKLMEKAK